MKLPKQYKHWFRLVGFKPFKRYGKLYFFGRGRWLRVTTPEDDRWVVQISENLKNFDRWANSTAYTIEGICEMNKDKFLLEMNEALKTIKEKGI